MLSLSGNSAKNADQRQVVKDQWELDTVACETVNRTKKLPLNIIAQAVETTHLTGICNRDLGFSGVTSHQVFNFLFSTYGRIASHQKNNKIEKINDPLDPNALVSFLWERTADCQLLDVAVGAPFTSEQIVQCAISAILSTGRHAEAHCNFMHTHQQNQRTCQNVINHFTQEHVLQNEAEVTTHQQGCANALQQLVNANVADCSAFSDSSNDQDSLQQAIDQMTTQNQQLQAQLAAQQQQMNLMQQQMANLTTQPPVAPQPQLPPTPPAPPVYPQPHQPTVSTRTRGRGRGGGTPRAATQPTALPPPVAPVAPPVPPPPPPHTGQVPALAAALPNVCLLNGMQKVSSPCILPTHSFAQHSPWLW